MIYARSIAKFTVLLHAQIRIFHQFLGDLVMKCSEPDQGEPLKIQVLKHFLL